MTLKFKEWDALNEASVFDKIKTWFSSNFGGAVSKLDGLLSDYRSAELEYADEWQEIAEEMDKLDLERDQTKSDPAELKKIERYIQRNREVLANSKKAHAKKIDHMMNVVRDVISDNSKLRNYWEMNKSRVDADVSEEMYKRSKDLAVPVFSGGLYDKYKAAVLLAKKKDTEFREKYGDLMGSAKKEQAKSSPKSNPSQSANEASVDLYMTMSLSDFTESVADMEPAQAKALASTLTKKRNDLYTEMEMEREALNDAISKKTGIGANRDDAAKKIKEIIEKYMEAIRDLRSKITIARRRANA
jgi:hypothetical protein